MKDKICCIFNIAPHYNEPIYSLMDEELKCDFYIGNEMGVPIQLMDYNKLKGFKKSLKFVSLISHFYWQKGAVNTALKPYEHYIITGEPYSLSTWLILIITKISNKKTYLWSHGWYGNETLIKKNVKKLFFKLATKVLLYGDYARNLMINEGIPSAKLISIYNSLDYEKQVETRKSLTHSKVFLDHFNTNYPTIIYIGRIQKAKKIDLLIEAIFELRKVNLHANLVIIGKDIDGSNIKSLVDKYELNNQVWFYGECYDEKEIGELIFNSNVCVVPGNIGLTVMHSFVYGTPVITHNNFANHGPEFEAIIPGKNGDFFVENSVNDLCEKIKTWISINDLERESVRGSCYSIIDEKYNCFEQMKILHKTLGV